MRQNLRIVQGLFCGIAAIAGTTLVSTACARQQAEPDASTDLGRAYAAELSADAALRSSQLRDSAEGLTLLRAGDSSVKIGGFAQFRYLMNFRQNPGNTPGGHDSGFTNGFEAARTRLNATGNIGNKDLTFKIEGEFTRADGSQTLLDAFGQYALDNHTSLRWGQFQLPIIRDYYINPAKQLTVNNSITTDVFGPGYTQGVAVDWRGQHMAGFVSLNDGLRAANTDYRDPAESDVALTGRFDYLFGKDWARFDDFTSWRGESNAWTIGGTFHWQTAGNTAASASRRRDQVMLLTVEASFEGNGWNAYAAAIYQNTDPSHASNEFNDWGLILQGGYFVTDNVEVFGRWDGVFPDSSYGIGRSGDLNTITAGANWYLFPHSHAAKFTGDVQWTVNEASQSTPIVGILSGTNTGLRASNEDNQVALRLQFQLVF